MKQKVKSINKIFWWMLCLVFVAALLATPAIGSSSAEEQPVKTLAYVAAPNNDSVLVIDVESGGVFDHGTGYTGDVGKCFIIFLRMFDALFRPVPQML